MKKILRLFRTCGPGHTMPTGTLAIVDDDGATLAVQIVDGGNGSPRSIAIESELEVSDPSPQPERKTGLVRTRARGTSELMEWYFFKELPVTADVIAGSVVRLFTGPGVAS